MFRGDAAGERLERLDVVEFSAIDRLDGDVDGRQLGRLLGGQRRGGQ